MEEEILVQLEDFPGGSGISKLKKIFQTVSCRHKLVIMIDG